MVLHFDKPTTTKQYIFLIFLSLTKIFYHLPPPDPLPPTKPPKKTKLSKMRDTKLTAAPTLSPRGRGGNPES